MWTQTLVALFLVIVVSVIILFFVWKYGNDEYPGAQAEQDYHNRHVIAIRKLEKKIKELS